MARTTAPVTPEVPVARKPFSLRVGAPIHAALNEAVIHARSGYVFSEGPVEVLPNGWAWFDMHLGNPVEHLVQNAAQTIERSAANEEKARQEAIRQEARRLVEDEKREALAKQVTAIKADQARQIAALEKAAAEAIAAL